MLVQSISTRPVAWVACAVVVFNGASATAQFVAASVGQEHYAAANQPTTHMQTQGYQQTTPYRVAMLPQQTPSYRYQQAPVQQTTPSQQSVAYQQPMHGYTQHQPAYRIAQNTTTPAQSDQTSVDVVQDTAADKEQTTAMVDKQEWSNYAACGTSCQDCASSGCATDCCDTVCGSGCATSCGSTCASNCGSNLCLNDCGCRPERQWFAGFYALYMERNSDRHEFAYMVGDDNGISTPYYPSTGVTYLNTNSAGTDGQWGGEVRFGSTFGCASACGCAYQPYAWEVGYWGLDEDDNTATMTIDNPISAGTDPRIYSLQNMAGLEYDRDGTGTYRPLNDYVDYQLPVNNSAPDDIRLLGVRVRTRFEVQNVEINFWKFGTPSCSSPLVGGRLRSGAACGNNYGSCRPPRRFFINGLCGVRYMRIDDDLFQDYIFTDVDGTGAPTGPWPSYPGNFPASDWTIFKDIETDNQLVGFQLGCSMNWLVGCKWNFFADSNFGVYGNHIDVNHWVRSPGPNGQVRYEGTGDSARLDSSDEEVSFLGEARIGVGYQLSCNCRVTAAYRLIAVSGIALAADQIPPNYADPSLVGYIHSNGSLVLQGLQTGFEWKY